MDTIQNLIDYVEKEIGNLTDYSDNEETFIPMVTNQFDLIESVKSKIIAASKGFEDYEDLRHAVEHWYNSIRELKNKLDYDESIINDTRTLNENAHLSEEHKEALRNKIELRRKDIYSEILKNLNEIQSIIDKVDENYQEISVTKNETKEAIAVINEIQKEFKEDMKKSQKELEKERKEEEQRKRQKDIEDPNNWYIYEKRISNSKFFGCQFDVMILIYKDQGNNLDDDFGVISRNKELADLKINNRYNVISNIFSLKYQNVKFEPELPWRLNTLYQNFPESQREIVCLGIKDSIKEIPVTEKPSNEKDLKLAEIKIDDPNMTWAIATRIISQNISFGKNGCNEQSKIDNKVLVSIPPKSINFDTNLNLNVLPMESRIMVEVINAAKNPFAFTISGLSSIVAIEPVHIRNLQKPATIQVSIQNINPITQNTPTLLENRPVTAKQSNGLNNSKPKIASLNRQHSDTESNIKIGISERKENLEYYPWKIGRDQNFSLENNGEIVRIIINKLIDCRYIAFRQEIDDETSSNLSAAQEDQYINALMENYDKNCKMRSIQFVIGQNDKDPKIVSWCCCVANKIDKATRFLQENNYVNKSHNQTIDNDNDGLMTSVESKVLEQEKIFVKCVGNIKFENDFSQDFFYLSGIINTFESKITVIDEFAQQNRQEYFGEIIFSRYNIEKAQDETLWNVPLTLQKKQRPVTARPITAFKFDNKDIVTNEYLEFLSKHLNDESWIKFMQHLNIKYEVLKTITGEYQSFEQKAYVSLTYWIKNLEIGQNKDRIMLQALQRYRPDLASDFSSRMMHAKKY